MSTALDTPRTSPPHVDRDRFWNQGHAIVRRLFDPTEIETLRNEATRAMAELDRRNLRVTDPGPEGTAYYARCDVLSIPEVRHVLLDRRLVAVIRELLGDQPTYFGESVLRIGKHGGRAWHRDNVDRVKYRGGPDWHDPYPILRCGVYMQDQAHYSGGLALRPRSNRPGMQIRSMPVFLEAEPGDLVVWDLRTVHSGEVVRFRFAPKAPLHPSLQTRLPESLRLGDERERIVIFMTFGLRGAHLDHYIDYSKTRAQNRELWATSRFGPDVWKLAADAGLDLLAVTPEYGAPPEP
jgi:Phytanoyl-CoA dioxygenase (PhyH)